MNENKSSLLTVKDLQVHRGGAPVLDISSLDIAAGNILSLIGPNGAGKSSLLLALSFLINKTSGEIFFHGRHVLTKDDIFTYRRRLAMVFQEPLLLDTTVRENIAAGLKMRHKPKDEMENSVARYAEMFGITHLLTRSARAISGGEAQRTSLARALATEPELVFLDEPFASLDPPTKEALLADLQRILSITKTTAVITTHDRNDALRLSDYIAVMKQGEIIQQGRPEDIMNRPADEYVAGFVGVETVVRGEVIASRDGINVIAVAGNNLEATGDYAPGSHVLCCIRPEYVTIAAASGAPTSARNIFNARIEKISPLGLFYKVELDVGFPLISYVTSISLDNLALAVGKNISASFKATALHLIPSR